RYKGASMKVTTWNVNGIRARVAQVLEWVARESPDVLCMQEIKASPEHVPPELSLLDGYWGYWHGHKGYSGVSLHLRKSAFPRKPEQIGQTPAERALLEAVIAPGFVDLSRKFKPDDDRLFTWWAPWRNMKQKNIGWRLDYVLAGTALAEKATSCEVHREFGSSDHGPVQAIFDLPPAE